MIVEIRMYKQYDLDLLSLFDAGYPVATLYYEVIKNFANGFPVKFVIDEPIKCELKDKHTVRSRICIKDKKAVKMLKGIKRRYRNAFCKMLLRNSLLQQNMDCFFSKPEFFVTTALNLENLKNPDYVEIPLSTIKNKRKIVIPKTEPKKNADKPEEIVEQKPDIEPKPGKVIKETNIPRFLADDIKSAPSDTSDKAGSAQNFSDDEDDDLYAMFSKL